MDSFAEKENIQDGGLYISTSYDPSSLLISGISQSTLSSLLFFANISSFNLSSYAQLSQLTIAQINALIIAVTQQIQGETAAITANQAQINLLNYQINVSPGLQNIYNVVNQQYISVQNAYTTAQNQLTTDSAVLFNMVSTMMGLSTLSTVYGSSIQGYQTSYSSLYWQIFNDQVVIANEESTFNGNLSTYIVNSLVYNASIENYMSSARALSTNTIALSTVASYYYSTSTVYGYDLVSYNWLSSQVSTAYHYYTSTQRYIDSLNDRSSLQWSWYISSLNAMNNASSNVRAAQAQLDYQTAFQAEINAIAAYDKYYNELIILQGETGITLLTARDTRTMSNIMWNPPTGNITVSSDNIITATGTGSLSTPPIFDVPCEALFTISPGNSSVVQIGFRNSNNSSCYIDINNGVISLPRLVKGNGAQVAPDPVITPALPPGVSQPVLSTTADTEIYFSFNTNYNVTITVAGITVVTNYVLDSTTPSYSAYINVTGGTTTNTFKLFYYPKRQLGGYIQDGGAVTAAQMTQLNNLSTTISYLSISVWQSTLRRLVKAQEVSTIEANTLSEILIINDSIIASARYNLSYANYVLQSTITKMSSIWYQIQDNNVYMNNDRSSLLGYSTLYIQDYSTAMGYLNMVDQYSNIERIISTYYQSTLTSIINLLWESTLYNRSITQYTAFYNFYRDLEEKALVSVNTFSTAIGFNNSSINGYTYYANNVLNPQIGAKFQTLNTDAYTFYSQKLQYLQNEMNEYTYAIQEWNSFTGYLTSELLIYKLNLYTQIDAITFDLQTANPNPANAGNKASLISLQGQIQNVIDAINPLDQYFQQILLGIPAEITNKTVYINTRSTLTGYEIMVLQNPNLLTTVQSVYIYNFGQLQQISLNIEGNINTRNTILNTNINSVLNTQMPIVQSLNILSYTPPAIIDTTIDPNRPFIISKNDYILLSTLNYGLSPVTYNQVLGIP